SQFQSQVDAVVTKANEVMRLLSVARVTRPGRERFEVRSATRRVGPNGSLPMNSPREHDNARHREGEDSYRKGESDDAHTSLREFSSGVGKEKHRREQDSVGQILARQIPCLACLLNFSRCRFRRLSSLACSAHF